MPVQMGATAAAKRVGWPAAASTWRHPRFPKKWRHLTALKRRWPTSTTMPSSSSALTSFPTKSSPSMDAQKRLPTHGQIREWLHVNEAWDRVELGVCTTVLMHRAGGHGH
jgi:hypothetical protein